MGLIICEQTGDMCDRCHHRLPHERGITCNGKCGTKQGYVTCIPYVNKDATCEEHTVQGQYNKYIEDKHNKDKGTKFDDEKPKMALIPAKGLVEVAKVMTFGAKKYGNFNWKKGIAYTRLLSATLRHINAIQQGNDYDDETGIHHAAHAVCNLLMLIETDKKHDDRFKE